VDVYSFPWLRYLTDKPGNGFDYLIQAGYKIGRNAEITTRFKHECKSYNEIGALETITPVGYSIHSSWRTQLNIPIRKFFSIRNRIEFCWHKDPGDIPQEGFLIFFDVLYKPMMKRFSGNFRASLFDTDGYDSRIYAFEPDVLYSYSMPAYYGRGVQYCFNINYDLTEKISFWAKWVEINYFNVDEIGTGQDLINGHKKTGLKLQMALKF
jgi:hypothetical protein